MLVATLLLPWSRSGKAAFRRCIDQEDALLRYWSFATENVRFSDKSPRA